MSAGSGPTGRQLEGRTAQRGAVVGPALVGAEGAGNHCGPVTHGAALWSPALTYIRR